MKSGLKTVCRKYLHEIGRLEFKLGEAETPALNWEYNELLANWLNKELAITHQRIFLAILSFMIFVGIGGGIFLVFHYFNFSWIIKVILIASLFIFLLLATRWLHHQWFEKNHLERVLALAKDISPNQMAFIIEVIYQNWSKPFLKQILSNSPKLSKNLLTREKLAKTQDVLEEYHFLQTKLQSHEAIVILTEATEKGVIRVITLDQHFEIQTNLSELTRLTRHYANWLGTVAGMRVTIPPKPTTYPLEKVTIQTLKAKIKQVFWELLENILNHINHLYLITYDELNQLPYELGAPEKLTFSNYPDLISYYHLRYATTVMKMSKAGPSTDSKKLRDKLPISYLIPCNDAPLGINVYDAADYSPEMHIPLVHAEAGMVKNLWNPAVHQSVDIECGKPVVNFLHLSGHGKENIDKPGGTAYLLLGNNHSLSVEQILRSPLHPHVVFLSACVVGTALESDDKYSELISAFFRQGGEYVIAPTIPVPDFYMPILAILFHQAWQKNDKHDPDLAWTEAKRRFQKGDWYSGTEEIVKQFYRPILVEHFQNIAVENNLERWQVIRKSWLPEKYRLMNDVQFNGLLEDELQDEEERHQICEEVLGTLCDNKADLDIDEFSAWVKGFGSKK